MRAKMCWKWIVGKPIGQWCDCGHIDVIHNRAGACAVCAVVQEVRDARRKRK